MQLFFTHPTTRKHLKCFDTGVNIPRLKSVKGEPLPNARNISNVIHKGDKCLSSERHLTIMYMSWGQFLDHDLVGTPVTKGMHCSNFAWKCR